MTTKGKAPRRPAPDTTQSLMLILEMLKRVEKHLKEVDQKLSKMDELQEAKPIW